MLKNINGIEYPTIDAKNVKQDIITVFKKLGTESKFSVEDILKCKKFCSANQKKTDFWQNACKNCKNSKKMQKLQKK